MNQCNGIYTLKSIIFDIVFEQMKNSYRIVLICNIYNKNRISVQRNIILD